MLHFVASIYATAYCVGFSLVGLLLGGGALYLRQRMSDGSYEHRTACLVMAVMLATGSFILFFKAATVSAESVAPTVPVLTFGPAIQP